MSVSKEIASTTTSDFSVSSGTKTLRDLSQRMLHCARQAAPTLDFIRDVSATLLEFSGCDSIELWVKKNETYSRYLSHARPGKSIQFEVVPSFSLETEKALLDSPSQITTDMICGCLLSDVFDHSLFPLTPGGTFWTNDAENQNVFLTMSQTKASVPSGGIEGKYKSLAVIPIRDWDERMGLLQLKSVVKGLFTSNDIEVYEEAAQSLVIALLNHHAQAALHERIKELTCLYRISQVAERPDKPVEEIVRGIAEILPFAWQYPDITQSRITLGSSAYTTKGFKESHQTQKADIVVKGECRGSVEVIYTEEKPEIEEGPFLKEERNLIDAIAREIALIIERREALEDKARLEEQLRHSDRLATIGEIAAAIAHELNEPLGNILGFAQLAEKCPQLPEPAAGDLEKIIKATLHAREIIRKLVSYSRQMPPRESRVNLNQVVEEGLYFFESRCVKEGIELVRNLEPELPEIVADPIQITQILFNLIVNSLHSMPRGGTITVETLNKEELITLIVRDTGSGMTEEDLDKIFLPFFTTKEAGEGTGLGLAVVHGIVTSHGGTIDVQSAPGRGTQFEIRLPIDGPMGSK